jgi:hypothetical protein
MGLTSYGRSSHAETASTGFQLKNVRRIRCETKKPGYRLSSDISVARLSSGDPEAFRPILADGLVVSCIYDNIRYVLIV